ncbi:MAG TPA: monovalent cation/H(+) antiporter subunit G [Amaricoccus sp.]|uniref:monovalent cation/H(+) antiporter subunit G n=1 Tax=Amaricoccus sp. TaxID=1872485 RepID=UPI002C70AF5B|nr:monovalent cation/H(+) antiporter subunit G [Amaricoccus sp.]HMQ94308.1 monovalent cation/H(+) antiporter subunit G [Amaricoccus sp.]HMR53972.1 monovalent cation/H(+) antiporter subunit G [Amaricoccus sp.]HMR60952.1 monovalent cation/H(+) antiporter subunit G [Amaricoccus sp.]HMU00968.1 monovalent cation/H(+) antiporter subunit G [Amaricoccus sp.]
MSDSIAAFLFVAGGFFCMVAGIGLIRLNDVFARMHAATKAGTLGLGLICIAVMVKAGSLLHVAEALFVFLFMIASAPVGSHLIGRASWRTRVPMDPNTQIDPDCRMFLRNRAR